MGKTLHNKISSKKNVCVRLDFFFLIFLKGNKYFFILHNMLILKKTG